MRWVLLLTHQWWVARFGAICTILKTWKTTVLKPATLLKVSLLHGCFSRYLNCANVTKSRNASHTLFDTMRYLFMQRSLFEISLFGKHSDDAPRIWFTRNLLGLLQKQNALLVTNMLRSWNTAQKMKFSVKYFFRCDQIRSLLRIWSYLLKKSLIENLNSCTVKELLESVPDRENKK